MQLKMYKNDLEIKGSLLSRINAIEAKQELYGFLLFAAVPFILFGVMAFAYLCLK